MPVERPGNTAREVGGGVAAAEAGEHPEPEQAVLPGSRKRALRRVRAAIGPAQAAGARGRQRDSSRAAGTQRGATGIRAPGRRAAAEPAEDNGEEQPDLNAERLNHEAEVADRLEQAGDYAERHHRPGARTAAEGAEREDQGAEQGRFRAPVQDKRVEADHQAEGAGNRGAGREDQRDELRTAEVQEQPGEASERQEGH